jgi:hypothetical protein
VSIKTGVRGTSEPFVSDVEIQHQRHRTRLNHEETSQFDVPTSMTLTPIHLLCFHFVGCPKEMRNLINHPVVILLDTRVGGGRGGVVPIWNFLQPQSESGIPVRIWISTSTEVVKKVCQRRADQTSSVWCGLIFPLIDDPGFFFVYYESLKVGPKRRLI